MNQETKRGIGRIVTTRLRELKTGLCGKGNKWYQEQCGGLLKELWTLIQSISLLERSVREKKGILLLTVYSELLFGT